MRPCQAQHPRSQSCNASYDRHYCKRCPLAARCQRRFGGSHVEKRLETVHNAGKRNDVSRKSERAEENQVGPAPDPEGAEYTIGSALPEGIADEVNQKVENALQLFCNSLRRLVSKSPKLQPSECGVVIKLWCLMQRNTLYLTRPGWL